jgi:hypothetical protein
MMIRFGCPVPTILIAAWLLAGCGTGAGPVSGVLQAGAAAVVITPVVEPFEDLDGDGQWEDGEPFSDLDQDKRFDPVWIAGFGSQRPALGVHDDLYARALILVQGDVRIGIVTLDWVGLMRDQALEIGRAARRAGVVLDKLIVSCTHNHEGPDSMGLWGPLGVSGRDDDYLDWAREQVVAALSRAQERLVPVRLVAGAGKTENLTRDSRLPIVLHEDVVALRFDSIVDGDPVAVVTHWSNHVEVLGGDNQQLSADFPASLISAIEDACPGAVGIYWQGMVGGLMTPLGVELTDEGGNVLPEDSFAKTERMGRLVADVALSALENGEDAGTDGRLAYRSASFFVPLENLELKLAGLEGLFERKLYDEKGRERQPSEIMLIDAYLETEASVIDLGKVQIVTVPGELYPELALEGPDGETFYQDPQDPGADFYPCGCSIPIYHYMRQTPYRIVLGLSNDELGYIIPRCQFDGQAPYAYGDDEPQYGEGFSVGPDLAPLLNTTLAGELQALAAEQAL